MMSRQGVRNVDDDRYDRYMQHNEQSTVHKLKETYWTTKQYVKKKLGKKEDEHVVSSDAQLDSKLEVFTSIQTSCMDLLRAIEKYQDRLCALSQEENTMGRFLKSESGRDKTRAGKMMAAVGKTQSHASQQRLALRVPLVRLYQEVETFRYRAISDTLMTINRMEAARTEYRGALMWMKDISEDFDPDTYKQLEKFRKVQAQVKKTKARFDKLKLDTMQKIDLLAASRCNMFSHVLVTYQQTLLHFWNKTSRTHSAVAESFKGYQYYEFSMLKELAEPSKELADKTRHQDVSERDIDGAIDNIHNHPERSKEAVPEQQHETPKMIGLGLNSDLIGLDLPATPLQSNYHTNDTQRSSESPTQTPPLQTTSLQAAHLQTISSSTQSMFTCPQCNEAEDSLGQDHPYLSSTTQPLLQLQHTCNHNTNSLSNNNGSPRELYTGEASSSCNRDSQTASTKARSVSDSSKGAASISSSQIQEHNNDRNSELIGLDVSEREYRDEVDKDIDKGSMNNLYQVADRQEDKCDRNGDNLLEFDEEEQSIEEIKRKQDEEFGEFMRKHGREHKQRKEKGSQDVLTDAFEPDDTDRDDLTLLNEILNAPAANDEFSTEWSAVFGDSQLNPTANHPTPTEQEKAREPAQFMPSSLLDLGQQMGGMNLGQGQMLSQGMMGVPQQQPMRMHPGMMAGAPLSTNHVVPSNQPSQPPKQVPQPKSKKQKASMSAWFNLFADLDPLSNPDAIGKEQQDVNAAL